MQAKKRKPHRAPVFLLVLLASLIFAPVLPTRADSNTPTPVAGDPEVRAIINRMSPAQRVGQLFIVTFQGDNPAPDSDIAALIRENGIGGVLLLQKNGNFSNADDHLPQSVLKLTNRLQALAFNQALSATDALTPTVKNLHVLPPPTFNDENSQMPITNSLHIPLLIAIHQEGDGAPYTSLINGFSPLPSQMAIGATWQPKLSRQIGTVVGRELSSVGINMLFGPSLDVLQQPRPAFSGDLGVRTFGGDPYWVGQMGEQFIAGVHEGSRHGVLTIATHFPGQGSSDRRPDEEIATIAKSLSELRNVELAPFAQVTNTKLKEKDLLTDGLLTSHIRYQGFQGNIRQRTPPISLAPQLQEIMALDEFRSWHQRGGLLVSDSLGAQAVRRYKDPEMRTFPYRQVAREALLAGNDLLLLADFSLHGDEKVQMENIRSTISFFKDKYVSDGEFRQRVDEALTRILHHKLALYHQFTINNVLHRGSGLSVLGHGTAATSAVARQAVTLLYPGKEELADRLPAAPQHNEHILFLVDDQTWRPCPNCEKVPLLPKDALRNITLSLYGPHASNQITPSQVRQLTFSQLNNYLGSIEKGEPPPASTKETLQWADWVVIALLHIPANLYPDRDTLSRFLRLSTDQLRGKHTILFAFNAPYYLDATEISKLTAFYALYAKTKPFQEMAIRTLFREFVPTGNAPVNVPAIAYDLSVITEPDPTQVVTVKLESPLLLQKANSGETVQLKLGDKLTVATGVIVDHDGHPVPDNTPVEFRFFYPAESLEARHQVFTQDGIARFTLQLDHVGEMWVSAQALQAKISTQLFLNIRKGKLTQVETVVPTPTPTPTPTATPTATPTPSPTPTLTMPLILPTPLPPAPQKRVNSASWLGTLLGLMLFLFFFVWWSFSLPTTETEIIQWSSMVAIAGIGTYILYALGLMPGATWAARHLHDWGPLLYAMGGATLPAFVLWLLHGKGRAISSPATPSSNNTSH